MVLPFFFRMNNKVAVSLSMLIAEYFTVVYAVTLRRMSNGWTRIATYDHWYLTLVVFYSALLFWPVYC
jgi:hypothetical protein